MIKRSLVGLCCAGILRTKVVGSVLRSTFYFKRHLSDISKGQTQTTKPMLNVFQDANAHPVQYHILQKQQQQQQQKQQNHDQNKQLEQNNNKIRGKLSIFELFKNENTRRAAFTLFLSLSITQVIVFYMCSNAILDELEDTENKLADLWDFYERKDISQTVMAVHIGQLKQQLINSGIKPVTSQQSLTVAQHLLSFARDKDTGNLMIYVDPNSSIYKLVPFSYEYDINKVPRLDTAADKSWDEFNRGSKQA